MFILLGKDPQCYVQCGRTQTQDTVLNEQKPFIGAKQGKPKNTPTGGKTRVNSKEQAPSRGRLYGTGTVNGFTRGESTHM